MRRPNLPDPTYPKGAEGLIEWELDVRDVLDRLKLETAMGARDERFYRTLTENGRRIYDQLVWLREQGSGS